jgi:hypothetical protein
MSSHHNRYIHDFSHPKQSGKHPTPALDIQPTSKQFWQTQEPGKLRLIPGWCVVCLQYVGTYRSTYVIMENSRCRVAYAFYLECAEL